MDEGNEDERETPELPADESASIDDTESREFESEAEAAGIDFDVGVATLLLLLQMPSWMHRRVESVTFLDAASMRRQVSIDLTIPEEGDDFFESPLLPLALIKKSVLVDFNLWGSDGKSLPLLTKVQNGQVSWWALTAAAQYEASQASVPPPSSQLLENLNVIAAGTEAEATAALAEISARGQSGSSPTETALMEGDLFPDLAATLATRFLLLTPTSDVPGTRTILKFSHVQSRTSPESVRERFLRGISKMGWVPAEISFRLPSVGEAESYHFELHAPPELVVSASQILVERPDDSFSLMDGEVVGSTSHLYVSGESPETKAFASVWVRLPRPGLVRAGVGLTGLTFAFMFFLYWHQRILDLDTEPSTAILLTIPALMSSFLVRPGEHGLATSMFIGVRGAVAAAGLSALTGAVLLMSEVPDRVLYMWWKVLVYVTWICFLSCVLAMIGLGPVGKVKTSGDVEVDGGL